ncbi:MULTISPECIES: PD-(D/E)XK motif protein [Pseudomonas syringae group genomosp. 2]|uniref:PD-(D/E)XK motif protein n=1 Tax=Pseudomonas savastanoi pv. phaseolicola TaxID=319 RepID=A0ABD4B9T7_PSESH|nr:MULTISPECIES: PD-(D/E)XK motif protein [Pseudomonas syringae group genomosp. 2]EFW82266.1 hypothetical protein PsgB076_03000 [Pseudomonas savastanoi pv. glycinea str. B076]KPC37218.1 Uncharacterized protein AC498_0460 [Pseudomonas savastanoi pv. glycinea]KPC45796.1 Uncharacterized protein ABK00_0939 [Pseudomonas savastanoi pv. glycinea]KPY10480.1 Uncharacterized protein ALO55_02937 [Pseudomonas savastanoi pv. phaseolicola]MBN3470605.1 PD-(D/E)XK motif protein [Pseudomonas savastanoi pv. pha
MLTSLFSELSAATESGEFFASAISTERKDFLAKGAHGEPVFLIHDASPAIYAPGVQYRYVDVRFHNLCRVSVRGVSVQDKFAIITCASDVPELYDIFIKCFGAVIETLPATAETKHINSVIQDVLDLFRELIKPSAIEITGFWAELFIIKISSRKFDLLRQWHNDPYERFDFSLENGFLEVKATTKTIRVHEFSLNQLRIPEDTHGLVASLLMLPSDGGIGVMDLARDIDQSISAYPDLRKKLWSNVAKALGADFSQNLDRRFDWNFSKDSFRLYSFLDIPTFSEVLDSRISNVRYAANLEGVESSLHEKLRVLYGFPEKRIDI